MVVREKEAKEYVLHLSREQDVKLIRLWFTDILGTLKGSAVMVDDLEGVLEEGMVFDGSSMEGFARFDESDMVALPDPSTYHLLPWRPADEAIGIMFCDVLLPDGKPFEGDPRYVLKQNLRRAAEVGYTYYVAPEMEYFYFHSSDATEPLDKGGYFDLTPLDVATDLRRQTVLALEDMGIAVESSHHEGAISQHEIDLRYTDGLTMADNVMAYRLVVKEVALRNGVYATFMPKPIYGVNGSGMHTYLSLFKGDKNAFKDVGDSFGISSVAKGFVAGLLRHALEITLVTNQWVNSYKRLVPAYEAPMFTSWTRKNRSDLIRIPDYEKGKEVSTQIEYRAPDPACNPYLAFSVLLAAGLEGIDKGYEVPPPADRNVFEMSDEERKEKGIEQLPGSLWEAINLAEKSELLKRCLGEHVFHSLIQNKKMEWEEYRAQVTDHELKRYLPIL